MFNNRKQINQKMSLVINFIHLTKKIYLFSQDPADCTVLVINVSKALNIVLTRVQRFWSSQIMLFVL